MSSLANSKFDTSPLHGQSPPPITLSGGTFPPPPSHPSGVDHKSAPASASAQGNSLPDSAGILRYHRNLPQKFHPPSRLKLHRASAEILESRLTVFLTLGPKPCSVLWLNVRPYPVDDIFRGSSGGEDRQDASLLQPGEIVLGNDPPPKTWMSPDCWSFKSSTTFGKKKPW